MELYDYQQGHAQIIERALREERVALDTSDTGCHKKGTFVLMFNGDLKKVEDIEVGDQLMGWDSTPRTVGQLFRGREEMIKVVPVKGEPFVVNKSHILTLQYTSISPNCGLGPFSLKIIDISIRDYVLVLNETHQRCLKLIRRGVTSWEEKELPMSPYHLGALLGDGHLGETSFSFTKPGEEMKKVAEEIAAFFGAEFSTSFRSPNNPSYVFRKKTKFKQVISDLGLLDTRSATKFVPQEYKVASWKQRSEMLAGLLDTDGHVVNTGYDFISASQQLSEDVAFISRSLGLAAYVTPCRKGCQTGVFGDYWRVSISGDCSFLPTRLKIAPPRTQIKSVLRTGFSIEELPEDDYYGFSLDGDGRFLLGDFTVTHNTGKTVVACHVLSKLRLPTVVVCPKSVIPGWQRTLSKFGVQAEVVNYEKLRTGNTPFGKWEKKKFVWSLPEESVVAWDEAHRAKAPDTKNAKMVVAAKPYRNLFLSATLAESPLEMRAVGYLTGLHSWHDWWTWCRKNGCRNNPWGGMFFGNKAREKVLHELHDYLYPRFGSRIRVADLGDRFPQTLITAEVFDFGDDLQTIYDEMEESIQKLSSEDFAANALVAQLRARQEVERRKVDGLVRMAEDAIAEGMSVVIFTNFLETLHALCEALKCEGIYGGDENRQQVIDDFLADKTRCVIAQVEAGGVGVDLHDINGVYPRLALVCPTYNGKSLRQALGRVHRANGKSKSIQKIVFASGTIEEQVCESVKAKLENIDLLNDADLNILKPPLSEPATMDAPETIVALLPERALEATDLPVFVAEPSNETIVLKGPTTFLPAERSDHAKFSPSSLKYRLSCPGWVGNQSPDRDMRAAERGTRGHEAWEKDGAKFILDDPVLRESVEMCVEYSRRFKGASFREQRVYMIDQYGRFDQLVVNGDDAFLLDAKFSNNFHKADSPQFWAYVVGIWDDPRWSNLKTIEVHVLMPFLGQIDTHKFVKSDYEDLKLRIFNLIEAARRADPETFRPFHGCLYCGRAGVCPKLAKMGVELATRYGEKEIKLPEGTLHGSQITDPETMAILLDAKPIVEKAAGGWGIAAADMWQKDGIKIPGYDLIERAGTRKVTNAAAAYEIFEEKGGTASDFIEIATVPLGELENLYAELAPKGKKGAWKQDLNDLLTDREAISAGNPSFYLKKQKHKSE